MRYMTPEAHCKTLSRRITAQRQPKTNRTNNCCAMITLRDRFSNMIATPPAIAPATTACHRRVFLYTHCWCACAERDSRGCRLDNGISTGLTTPDSSSSSSSSGEGGVLDGVMGRTIGSELRMALYSATKEPNEICAFVRS